MSAARDEILTRVRAAKRGATAPVVPRDYRHTDPRSAGELTELFCERVGDYGAEVQRVSEDELAAAITDAAARRKAQRLVVPAELPSGWRPDDLELIADERLTPCELDALDGVITGCTVAIAETGTIVLSGNAHEGRRVLSLVPDLHICIVRSDQVLGSVPEAITKLRPSATERRPLTFISGPSATSDIELQRIEGVHGPRKLVVLVMS